MDNKDLTLADSDTKHATRPASDTLNTVGQVVKRSNERHRVTPDLSVESSDDWFPIVFTYRTDTGTVCVPVWEHPV